MDEVIYIYLFKSGNKCIV